jgi:hypothetical protein
MRTLNTLFCSVLTFSRVHRRHGICTWGFVSRKIQ